MEIKQNKSIQLIKGKTLELSIFTAIKSLQQFTPKVKITNHQHWKTNQLSKQRTQNKVAVNYPKSMSSSNKLRSKQNNERTTFIDPSKQSQKPIQVKQKQPQKFHLEYEAGQDLKVKKIFEGVIKKQAKYKQREIKNKKQQQSVMRSTELTPKNTKTTRMSTIQIKCPHEQRENVFNNSTTKINDRQPNSMMGFKLIYPKEKRNTQKNRINDGFKISSKRINSSMSRNWRNSYQRHPSQMFVHSPSHKLRQVHQNTPKIKYPPHVNFAIFSNQQDNDSLEEQKVFTEHFHHVQEYQPVQIMVQDNYIQDKFNNFLLNFPINLSERSSTPSRIGRKILYNKANVE